MISIQKHVITYCHRFKRTNKSNPTLSFLKKDEVEFIMEEMFFIMGSVFYFIFQSSKNDEKREF